MTTPAKNQAPSTRVERHGAGAPLHRSLFDDASAAPAGEAPTSIPPGNAKREFIAVGDLQIPVGDHDATQRAIDIELAELRRLVAEGEEALKVAVAQRDRARGDRDAAVAKLGGPNCPACKGSGEVEGEDCEDCDGSGKRLDLTPEQKADAKARRVDAFERRCRARIELEHQVWLHVDRNAQLAGMDDDQVRRFAVEQLDPDARLDGHGAEYLAARFDAAIERARRAPTASDVARAVVLAPMPAPSVGSRTDGRPTSVADASAAYAARQRGAWQQSKK